MTKNQKDIIKILGTADGLLLGAKLLAPMLPNVILGMALPQYMVASISLGIIASGYSRFKIEKSKVQKDKEITESDLFELED